ncbi:UTP--glucose-1-phosphate uridylyltransferase [bacterium]|nr:UTP--glucose-1-phosphate uridylyltransferase [bacterium]
MIYNMSTDELTIEPIQKVIVNLGLSAKLTSRIDELLTQFQLQVTELPIADGILVIKKCTMVLPTHIDRLIKVNTPDLVVAQFISMILKYILGDRGTIDLSDLSDLERTDMVVYDRLTEADFRAGETALHQVAFLKLNGGLGTTMGCTGPKSLIKVTDSESFLDIILNQISTLSRLNSCDIPLVLMNSYYTDAATRTAIGDRSNYLNLLQHQVPRIDVRTGEPVDFESDPSAEWNPPGHGDIYAALASSGTLDRLLGNGIRYLFVSNSDNLGATIDLKILGYMVRQNLAFLMETTEKTHADRKGGTLVRQNDRLFLLERAQVMQSQLDEFENIDRYRIFNTNNIWLDLYQIKARLDALDLDLPLIVNPKVVHGVRVDQLESAMGSGISLFERTASVVVPRTRFMPVKSVNDLLILRSDLVDKTNDGQLVLTTRRARTLPTIQLGSAYQRVDDFNRLIPHVPSLRQCRSLEVSGNVGFGKSVSIKGSVRITSQAAATVVISNCVFHDEEIHIDSEGGLSRRPIELPS